MPKAVFTVEEARRVAWMTNPKVLQVELHLWTRAGELVLLKRGVYGFPDRITNKEEIARSLYGPAYISLEYALHHYGLIPDVPFTVSLVTTRLPRRFKTPYGEFSYRKIQPRLFWGYDPDTLMGEQEKVIVDYCYLNSGLLIPKPDFWESRRWQNLGQVDFKKLASYARKVGNKKVVRLVRSLERYGTA